MRVSRFLLAVMLGLCVASSGRLVLASPGTPPALPTPEQFLGFRVGADTKLARWDKIVEYFRLVEGASDRVRVRELGKSTEGNAFIALEIAAPDTLKRLDYYRGLQRRLYFQDGVPTDAQRDEIFASGKAVVVVTCNIHSTEIGSSQMVLELVHRLATDSSPRVTHVLDNVIFLLVPSLNPDGQIKVVDWYNKNLGTEFEASPDAVALPEVRGPRQQPRHVHVHADREPAHREAAVARLVPGCLARRAPAGHDRLADLRHAGHRSDQPQRPPAHLPVERAVRADAGRGARGGGQGRRHLQLHLHELLAGRDGLERLVAQPGGPAHGTGVGARGLADRAAARRTRAPGAASG